ncbi:ROK family transcriptional regulator [Mycolicibacterium psychrotolerans]|uniref:Sugar kinase n=1 Tax=Mycolicibacterium psychrotolerans TaxID=216929 RepID=A0A7I7MAJ1_9MYCO|nr:ROK family transcriptional regulator [Mycolicibacterium psychrotolerans]BBX68503.1 sugar kinase [Mycolicibacterium psychrotolerans]
MTRLRTAPVIAVDDLYALIRDKRAISRAEIGALTGMSRTAVAARVRELTARGLVVEQEQAASSGGRPATLVSFNAEAGIVLTAAIGGSRARLAVCDLAGEIRAAADIDEEPGFGPGDLMPTVAARLAALLDESGHRGKRIFGIGISLPGTVDPQRGCSLDSPVLTGWDGVPLAPYFAALGGAPVVLENDANAFALAEWRAGAGRALDDVLVIKASTGLGAGIVAGGALQRGALGAAGEFGHDKTAAAGALPCRCGDVGCLEAVAGGWALVRALNDEGRSVRSLREVVELAHGGDPLARRLIRESGRHVGEVLAGAVNLLNPAALVVAGDVAGAYDIFVAGLRETLYGNATALATRSLQIVPSHLGDRAGVIGTAMMVLDDVLARGVAGAPATG